LSRKPTSEPFIVPAVSAVAICPSLQRSVADQPAVIDPCFQHATNQQGPLLLRSNLSHAPGSSGAFEISNTSSGAICQ
jgi:hypothetical protein